MAANDRDTSDATRPERPPTRAERREQTRALLIDAARVVFAEDGYHGASLERIAHLVGFSKGAVYSNFDGKAQLFLAVMDANLALVDDDAWSVFDDDLDDEVVPPSEERRDLPIEEGDWPTSEGMLSGVALATLEFIATAARDRDLAPQLARRAQLIVDTYARVADATRDPDDPLSAPELGALLTALDQGVALLSLAGAGDIDTRHARLALQRVANPARAAERELPGWSPGGLPVHDRALQRRMLRDLT